MKLFLLILSLVLAFRSPAQDDRIWIDANINNQPVHLILDTGAGVPLALFSSAVKKLGLEEIPPPAGIKPVPDEIIFAGKVKSCNLDFGDTNFDVPAAVLENPVGWHSGLEVDGVIGWSASKSNVLSFNGPTLRMNLLPSVPEDTLDWPRFPINTKGLS